jgi:hypothetical protein
VPIKAIKQFTAWSFSRLTDYEDCPRRAKFKHLDKYAEPGGPALERGSKIHKDCEAFVRGRLVELPPSLARFPEEFAELRKIAKDVAVEQQLAVDADWRPCDWFGPQAWLRVVVDASHRSAETEVSTIVMVDYKTGKIYPDKVDQLDLYGLVGLAYHPDIKRVDGAFWYLDQGEIINRSLLRGAEETRCRKVWAKRVKPMLADSTFAPTPGDGCRWCFFGQNGLAKGGRGLCEF